MPVMPAYTPGLGEALSNAFDTYRNVKRQKTFDALAVQQAADTHQGAQDTHTTNEIGNAVNYAFLPPGVTPTAPTAYSMPGPRAAALPNAGPSASSAPDDFTSTLAATFAGGPLGSSDNPSPADGGRAAPVNTRNAMGQQLVQAMAKRGSAQPTPAPQQAGQPATMAPGSDFQANMATAMGGGQRITLSNGATIDPMASFAREALKARLLAGVKSDADIQTALATGVIDKNTADALKARREATRPQLGDPGYAEAMGGVAAAESAAKLPTELRLAVEQGRISLNNALASIGARGQVEAGLQGNQQGFTAGQSALERDFRGQQTERTIGAEDRRQAVGLEGGFLNRSAEINQNHRSSILGRLTAAPASTVAPSAAVVPAPAAAANAPVDARTRAIDAMLKEGMTKEQIKAVLAGGAP